MQKELMKAFPEKPGVYFFFDHQGEILYIGKSINLKKRIREHFSIRKKTFFQIIRKKKKGKTNANSETIWNLNSQYLEKAPLIRYNKELKKRQAIQERTKEIRYLITETDQEAYALEGYLIATLKPDINRASWNYPFIELTLAEQIPRLVPTHQISSPSSYVFGPFTAGAKIKTAINGFLRLFPLCNYNKPLMKKQPPYCFRVIVNQCLAPCLNPQKIGAYHKLVANFIEELKSGEKKVLAKLQLLMEKERDEEHFEAAAKSRDQLQAISTLFSNNFFPFIFKKYFTQLQEILKDKPRYLQMLNS